MEYTLPTNNVLVRVWRFLRLFFLVFGALLIMIFCYPFLGEEKRLAYLRTWAEKLLKILNFEVVIKGKVPESFGGLLIMSNHVSWLDIFALNYIHPIRFVAKQEIRQWPILGGMVARGGTVFIDRTDKKDAVRISKNIAVCLQEEGTVALFPESTTTNGLRLLPLKAALFEASIIAQKQVQPVALLYYDEEHQRSTTASYEGETSLFQSLFAILKQVRKGYIEVVFCNQLDGTSGLDRFELCKQTQGILEQVIYKGLPPSEN